MSVALKNGDEVRIIKTGRVGILDEVNPNPDYDVEDEFWALVVVDEWNSGEEIDSPDEVELVRRAEDIPAKTLPTLNELRNAIASSSMTSFGNDIAITETDPRGEPDGQFLAYGRSATGLPFGFRVTISEIEQVDY